MDDDFNTAAALAAIHDLVRETNTILATDGLKSDDRSAVLDALNKFDSVLGIFGPEEDQMLDGDIEALIAERQAARHDRDFAKSDRIRDQLAEKGIILRGHKRRRSMETEVVDVSYWSPTLKAGSTSVLETF